MKLKQKGFTLIELLVVIAVIGLLAAIITLAVGNARGKARDARRKSDASALVKALDLYYQENNEYPNNGTVGNPNNATSAQNLASFLVPKFISAIPVDPKGNPDDYMYIWKQNGSQYGLYIPFGNDGGTGCKIMTTGGSTPWFSGAPVCNY